MTKTKKVVAMLLAFLMIFSSASVLASAWDVDADDGKTLEISTKIFKEVNGEWVETEKVAPGSNVKARVYIATDYYSNDSDLLFFYDKDFFTDNYEAGVKNVLTVNPESVVKAKGSFMADSNLTGYVDSSFLEDYASISVMLDVNTTYNVKFDDSTWLFEFDLVVLDSASGEGDFFVEEATVQNTTDKSEQYISVPKGPADGTLADVYPMWLWDATPVLSSQPVSTLSSVTFNANNGAFTDGETEKVIGTNIGEAVAAPAAPERAGYTFMGWIDAADATPTLEEAKATVVVAEVPEEPIAYNAFWLKNVNITFNTDGGSEIAPIEDVTPYTDFAEIAAPSREGYTFVGWDVRGGELPATYPDADTTYTAIWALNVTMTFDTDGGTAIPSVGGFEGDTFGDDENEVIPNPSKEGHRFVMWSPALPEVYPEADTTYTAVYEARAYSVSYFVDGKAKLEISLEYGEPVPTKVASVKVPAGYELSGWYTDEACTVEYAGGTMGAETIKLYAKTTPIEYNAIFVVDGETYETVPTAFEDKIAAPAAPSKAGYKFAGWSPDADGIFTETEDMYFYATWIPVDGDVIFYVDGEAYASFEANVGDGIETGAEIELPADPFKEGYTFKGWDGYTEGMKMPALAEGEKVTFNAIFEINSYKLTWNVDGATTENTLEYNADITAPADPEKEGYTFAGWEWTRTEGGAAAPAATKMPAYDVTATATWNVNQYTVKWIVDEVVIEETKYNYGATITKPADPEKAGYVFNGWTPVFVSTMGAADVTYTATWANATDTPYTIETYTMNADGSYGAPVSETKYGVTGESVTAAYVENDGFRLDAANSELTKAIAADGSTVLKVYLARNSYKVTTDVDGVTAEVADVLYGAEITEPAAPANKEGHTFAGWAEYTDGMTMPVGGQKFTATWTVNNYTVKWDVDGAITEETYAYGAAINKPADPEKVGYTFAGWTPAVPATQGAADATYTAQWTTNKYLVEFVVDGATVQSGEVEFGAAVTKPADPKKEGYTFAGWTPAVPATQGAADATYTASWTVNNYTVTWIVDGKVIKTETIAYGADVIAPAPEKDGYKFSGWSPAVPATQGAADATYEGSFLADSDILYTIETYVMDTEGNEGTPSTVTKAGVTDSEVVLTPEEKTGFAVDYSKSVLKGVVAADGSLVLKVYYTRNQYNVITNVDGDENVVETVYFEATVAEPVAPADKEGHTFAGWEGYTAGMKMPAEDVTLTAKWTVNNYTVTWDVDGATTEETYAYGATINKKAAPEKEGYTFAGWEGYTDGMTMPAEGKTFTATWTVNEYNVEFIVDGVAVQSGKVAYGAAVKAPADPAKEGYTFAGWSPAVPATQGAADATYTAQWTVNQYTVTYANTGDTTIAAVTADYGTAIAPVADPTWEGYSFTGWKWTNAEGVEIFAPATVPAYNVTATAQWKANSYTIEWIVDGTTVAANAHDFGADVTVPAAPEKAGYTFAGWTWAKEDGSAVASSTTMPAYNVVATAQWTAAGDTAYTVEVYKMNVDGVTYDKQVITGLTGATESTATYIIGAETGFTVNADKTTGFDAAANTANAVIKADGSTVIAVYYDRIKVEITINGVTDEYVYGEEITEPAKPEAPEGNEQDGWVDENGNVVTFPLTVDEDVPSVIKPNYKKLSYTIAWTIDGVTTTDTYEYEAAVTAPEIPAKNGYRVVGWMDASGKLATIPATMPASDLAYTAIYETLVYGVNYYVDGKLVSTVSAEYGEAINAAPYAAPFGYEFDGWYTDAEMTTELAEGATVEVKETDLYGKLVAKKYNATFIVDGEEYAVVETAFDAQIIAPADPVKAGYTFIGWTPDVGIMDAEGLTFTANFEPAENAFSVTYIVDGEEFVYPLTEGAEFEIPAEPFKEGYTFAGWVDAEGNIVDEFPKTMPAENLTYTATWTVISYTVTWIIDGVETEETYEFGATIVAPADPEKDGFEFTGWEGYTDGMTMPAEDLTFTAQWTEIADATPVKLVPVVGSTTMIERNKVIESYNDGYEVITDSYDYERGEEDSAFYETWYIYGLEKNFTEKKIDKYFTFQGDGRIEKITTKSNGGYGTGCVIKVWDRNGTEETSDDIFVEQFYIVIFGDVDGNGRITVTDTGLIDNDIYLREWSANKGGVAYMKKAASIDGNTRVTVTDVGYHDEVVGRYRNIDQVTGIAE